MRKQSDREKMLAEQPIPALLRRMSVPAIIGMFVNALYNIVDRIFLGQLGDELGRNIIGGLTIAFPVQIFLLACALLFGIGAASVVSRAFGARDYDKVNRTAGNVFATSITLGIILAVCGFILVKPLVVLLGATPLLKPFAVRYLSIIFFGTAFTIPSIAMNNLIRAEGKAKMAMGTMMLGAGLNIVLDPIFIYGFHMGIRGAAIATVLSQVVSFSWVMLHFLKGSSIIKIQLRNFRPSRLLFAEVLPLGFGAFLRQLSAAFLMLLINHSMKTYGIALGENGAVIAISAFGIVNSLLMFAIMPMLGISQGMQPVAGFNYGAKQQQRVKHVVLLSARITIYIGCLYFAAMMIFPQVFMRMFTPDSILINFGAHAIRYVAMSFPVVGIQIIGAAYFLAIGKAIPSMFLSLLRQVILLIPAVIVLPLILGLDGVLVAFPVSDFTATLITAVWTIYSMKKTGILQKRRISRDPEAVND